ncbi:MAG TPA: ribonuclease Z [Gemmatimonadaceae bacterium]
MRLTTVGSGVVASPRRVCSGHLVQADDVRLLMDCGSGVVQRMASLGVRWQEITHVALSHFHNDHVSDLTTLVFAWKWGDLPPRTAPAVLVGPVGTAALLDRLAAALGDWVREPGFPWTVREIAPGGELALADGVTLAAQKTPHTEESVAYALAAGGRRLVYTGDTGYDEGLAAWADGCDLLLAECSLPPAMAIPSHLTPEQVGRLARLARARRLVLTHFYPPVERTDVRAAVAREYDGYVALAHDGATFDI